MCRIGNETKGRECGRRKQEEGERGEGRRRRMESKTEWKKTKEIVEAYASMHRVHVKFTKRLNLRMRKWRMNFGQHTFLLLTPNKKEKEVAHLFIESVCLLSGWSGALFILLGSPAFRLSLLFLLSCCGFPLVVVLSQHVAFYLDPSCLSFSFFFLSVFFFSSSSLSFMFPCPHFFPQYSFYLSSSPLVWHRHE